MSLPDGAEYWWKDHSFHQPNDFRHAINVECGHNHNTPDTPYIGDLECHACKKIVQETKPEWMIEGNAPEMFYMSIREKKAYRKRKAFNEKHGICDCGCDLQIRVNKKNGQEFLGCINYPTCKKTKSIKNI